MTSKTEHHGAIAIIGMSARYPGAPDVQTLWKNVCNGTSSITQFTDADLLAAGASPATLAHPAYVRAAGVVDDIELFDAAFFGVNPREAELMDPQHTLFLEHAWDALESSGYLGEATTKRVGVFAGISISTYLIYNLLSHPDMLETAGGLLVKHTNDKDYVATRVSYKLNLRGPSMTVQTGCSTSLVATHLACQSLLDGECDIALAGGATINVPQRRGYLYQEGSILSSDGKCRPFDAKASGTVLTGGVGVVVLKQLSAAIEDGDHIHAVIRGTAVNNDGSAKVGFTAPGVEGQAAVIREAMAIAGVEPSEVSYVHAHGTGTHLGDPIEIAALSQAFGPGTRGARCAIGSVKANIGHANTAAGVAGLMTTALALEHRLVPPMANFESPNPVIPLDETPFYVPRTLETWLSNDGPRIAGVSSFGMGGTNAHAVLEEPPLRPTIASEPDDTLLLVSAKTSSALEAATTRLADWLSNHPQASLADVAYTLQVGRRRFPHRRFVVCRSVEEGVAALRQPLAKPVVSRTDEANERSIAFMFPGQGAQYVGMARGLYEREREFRECLDHCANVLADKLGGDIRALLFPASEGTYDSAERELAQTRWTQPCLFAIEMALAKLLASWGIKPTACVGHSVGEFAAACVAGVFSLEDGLMLVAERARLMQSVPPGRMLAVVLGEDELSPMLHDGLSLAAVNGRSSCVVSGPDVAIAEFERRLAKRGVATKSLRTSHAFHSAMMDPVVDAFARVAASVSLSPPKIPVVSNVTGAWLTAAEATDPAYWARHLRQAVRFADAVTLLGQGADRVLLEVGPGRTLASFATRPGAPPPVTTLRQRDEAGIDRAHLLKALGSLWAAGARVPWEAVHRGQERRRVTLPTYPFARQRYWIEPARSSSTANIPVAVEENPVHERPELTVSYLAPSSDSERELAAIWQGLIGIDRVGTDDDFFQLGGNSLLATQLVAEVSKRLGVVLALNVIFETTTVAGLAKIVDAARGRGDVAVASPGGQPDLEAEAVLDPAIDPRVPRAPWPARQVFVTGGTGYLGAFIVRELLYRTDARVRCLVRGKTLAEAFGRLRQVLVDYGLWEDRFEARLAVESGDLSRPLLGLTEARFDALAREVNAIYHCGALVNFAYPYRNPLLRASNVLGTQEVLRLAARGTRKPFHHVSTTAVFGSSNYPSGTMVREGDDPVQSTGFGNGYSQTKWVAEKLVRIARNRGLPVSIYRPGNILGDRQTGSCNPNDFISRMIKGCVQSRSSPDVSMRVDLTPIDYVASVIVQLSLMRNCIGNDYHPVNPNRPTWDQLIGFVRTAGYDVATLPYGRWRDAIVDPGSVDNALHPLSFMFPSLPEGSAVSPHEIVFSTEKTVKALADSSVPPPDIDQALMDACLSYFMRSGFLPEPKETRRV